jgi:hypothetical protein
MYASYMDSRELGLADATPTPSMGGAFILPVFFGVGTWAVYEFTRSPLGDWRYLPTAVLGLCAVYFAVVGAVGILAMRVVATSDKVPSPSPTRTRAPIGVFGLLIVAAIGVNIFLAVRDHSAEDALTAGVVAVWAVFGPGSAKLPLSRHARLISSNAANLLLFAWVVSTAVFRLH